MRNLFVAAVAVVSIVAPGLAAACGACVEDRVAATYDQMVIDRATAAHRQVVFVAIEGSVAAAPFAARVVAVAPRVRGVQAGSLRTSTSPPAFSFVLDAAREPRAAVAGFARELRNPAARLVAVRVMRGGALVEPD